MYAEDELPAGRALRSNLPLEISRFIGREREIQEVRRLLTTSRLLTLTGPGGVGKTRLALRIAADLVGEFPDGAWLIPFANVTDPDLVPQVAVSVLGLRVEPGRAPLDMLCDYLCRRSMLLVLDNCEHLVEACAQLAESVLTLCPQAQLLVTSREPLGLVGEIDWRVPSLSLPEPAPTPETSWGLLHSEAVRLFVDRASLGQPGFSVTAENAPFVEQVCRQLDGIPLAIELAAARLKVLSVSQIAERLGSSYHLLSGGGRTAPPRHQTLRATLDWSHDLLSPPEQAVFSRLAVFAGSWRLEAAEAICAGEGLAAHEILDLLGRLVDKSLLLAITDGARATRYRFLETVHQYAGEHLSAHGDSESIHRRHAAYYMTLAEDAEQGMMQPGQERWLDLLEEELDNLRVALRHLAERGDTEAIASGLRLAGALWFFWFLRGRVREGLEWLQGFLASTEAATPAAPRAKALYAAGFLASEPGPLEESLAFQRTAGDRLGIALSLLGLGVVLDVKEGDLGGARLRLEESLSISRDLGERWGAGWALSFLGQIAFRLEEIPRARELYQAGLEIWRQLGDREAMAYALHGLGDVMRAEGETTAATSLYEESLLVCRQVGDRPNIATTLASLGQAALDTGDTTRAHTYLSDSLTVARDVGPLADQATGRGAIARALAGLAELATAGGEHPRAARLAGAAATRRAMTGVRLPPSRLAQIERRLAPSLQGLGRAAYEAEWQKGNAMALDAAIADALAAPAAPHSGPPDASEFRKVEAVDGRLAILTPREREVASLVAHGFTNRQIAERLVISERTAEGHVASILGKLGLDSRAQLVVWFAEQGLLPSHPR